LGKYNKTKHPIGFKVVEGALYFLEYAVILPLIILLWFIVLTILLMLLTERSVDTLLLISATLIVAIRMTSYYHHDLSIELAKLVPFTLLATSLVSPEFFSIERVIGQITLIPNVFGHIFYYLFLIVIVEVVLRGFELLSSFFQEDIEVNRKK
jgi:hypothetical protein